MTRGQRDLPAPAAATGLRRSGAQMRIVHVETLGKHYANVTFARGTDMQTKCVRVTGLVARLSRDHEQEFSRLVSRAAVEANRDMICCELCKQDGYVASDKLRAHPEWRAQFPDLGAEVLKRLEQ